MTRFTERADTAAEALKKSMGLESTKVEVGPDGLPPPPPPPPGSYRAMQLEQQQAEAAARQTVLGDQPVAGTVDDLTDGSVAQPAPPEAQQPVEPQPDSPNVQRRFQELTTQLRESERARQEAEQKVKDTSKTNTELATRMQAIEEQHQGMLQENLAELDPETRMQVLQDARLQEMFGSLEKKLFDSIMPHVQGLEQANVHREMMELGAKYPGFDIQIHGPLIDMFKGKNQNCSVEQAFRAVAEGDEAVVRSQIPRSSIPPTVVPGGSGNGAPRYVPEPEADPEAEMVEDARRIAKLRSSANPEDQKEGLRLADRNISQRLAHRFGGM